MSNTELPESFGLVGKPDKRKDFESFREENEKRIASDPGCALLAEQMRDIRKFSAERGKQNVITLSMFQPYIGLFDPTPKTDLSPEVVRQRRILFNQYAETVINPQEITIILSDDKKWVVGAHDRILRPTATVEPTDSNATLAGTIISNQERKRDGAAGRGLDSFGAQFSMANHADNNPEQVKKVYLDSVLISVIQKELNMAIEKNLPGIPWDRAFTKEELVDLDPQTADVATPAADDDGSYLI